MKGTIFNIQNYCLSDGPGIRTVIFFKGCPLRCLWCENPESIYPLPQISFHASRCISCRKCQQACPLNVIDLKSTHRIDWAVCDNCGKCSEVCMSEALEMIGRKMTVEEIMAEIRKESLFYSRSGGGVTISGGEPTLQYDFLVNLLEALKNESYHIVLETSGTLQWNKLELLAGYVDIFYFDIKGIDPVLHKTNTGVDNGIILSNGYKLSEKKCNVVFRIPVIPGINYKPDQISLLDQFLTKASAKEIHLLPYHSFGEDKLNSIYTCQVQIGIPSLKSEYLESLKNTLEHSNRTILISGA